jgi:DNA-binding NarL/FixJ family response regulator
MVTLMRRLARRARRLLLLRTMTQPAIPSGLRAHRIALANGGEVVLFTFPISEPWRAGGPLTAAERGVVRAVLTGCTNTEIARTRGTSARTVANQIASAFRKLGVASRGQLAARHLDWEAPPAAASSMRATPRARFGL